MSTRTDKPTTEDAIRLSHNIYKVRVSLLKSIIPSAFIYPTWGGDVLTEEEVRSVPLAEASSKEYCGVDLEGYSNEVRQYHINRVAWFYHNGVQCEDDWHLPIFSVEKHLFNLHPLIDGNHRYAAAILRGDEYFTLQIRDDPESGEYIFGLK